MRILAVIETDLVNKGPHQTHHLLERLSLRGHQIRIIDYEITWRQNPSHSLISKRIVINGFSKALRVSKLALIRPRILHLPLLDYVSEVFSYGAEIHKQINEFKPDVVIGFSIVNTFLAMVLSKKHHIPFTYYLIDAQHQQIPEKILRLLGKAFESQVARKADKILVINEELGRYATGLGAHWNRISVLRAGIDPQRFNPAISSEEIRKKYGVKEDEIVLFFMGWLYSFSGLKEVMRSILEYEGDRKFRLMIVGKGDSYEELQKMKKNDFADRLILLDWQPYEKIPNYIAASDICLLPAYNNELVRHIVPIKMYEYMACGKPVIATKLPGLMKEFGEGNGIVYVDGPVHVLEKAASLARDREAIRKIGVKAANYVRKYSWENITDQFETILKELAKQ